MSGGLTLYEKLLRMENAKITGRYKTRITDYGFADSLFKIVNKLKINEIVKTLNP